MKQPQYTSTLTILLLTCVMTSCGNETTSPVLINDGKLLIYNEFPVQATLKGQKMGPTNYFMRPERLLHSGNMLAVFDGKNDTLFHLMDDGFNLKGKYGKIGDGPKEYKEVPMTWNHDFTKLGGIYSYFFGQDKVCKQQVDSQGNILKDSIDCFKLHPDLYNVQKLFVVNDDKMVGNGGMKEGKLFFFNPLVKGNVVITDFYPKAGQEISDEFKMYNFLGYLSSNVNKKKVVFVNTYFNQIELYSIDGELIREIRHGKSFDDDVAGGGRKNFYYYAAQMTDKYIYALYLGEANKNIIKSALGTLKSSVHIFDLEGQPIAELQLDRLVDDMFVNEDKKQIICISGEEEEQFFVQYDFPENY